MGFLDNVRDALKDAVSTQASKDDAVEETRKDDVAVDESDSATTGDAAVPPTPTPEDRQQARGDARDKRQEAPAPNLETYTVKVGDTLSEIGARFGVSPQEIARLNNIDNPDLIFPGQVFRIPKG